MGFAGGLMILLAVILLFVGGDEDGAAPPVAAPALELVQPQHGTTLRLERLVVVFRTEEGMGPTRGGWGADSVHLHLDLDGAEIMPGPGDVERIAAGTFRWTLPLPPPGLHVLRLLWSGPDHQPIPGAGSRAVQVRVEE